MHLYDNVKDVHICTLHMSDSEHPDISISFHVISFLVIYSLHVYIYIHIYIIMHVYISVYYAIYLECMY